MHTRNQSTRQLKLSANLNDLPLPVRRILLPITLLLTIVISVTWSPLVVAQQQVVVTTTKNLQHEGELFTIDEYSASYKPPAPFGAGNLIVVIDDGLRRVFIGQNSVQTLTVNHSEMKSNLTSRKKNTMAPRGTTAK